ncbi:hypothetical protein BD289DRAFT_138835 [Coniella lustricola]|uniref:EamA domain-containing protein n=1 Tax=Coniella lustricola TaxID=2025994 RepID=A0A2T2ZVF9_9PEZI|nr:hypothetical protein BD289DRAFT_138835 [Coniella lustricola]
MPDIPRMTKVPLITTCPGTEYTVDGETSSSSSSRSSVAEGWKYAGFDEASALEPKGKLDPGTMQAPSFYQVRFKKVAMMDQGKNGLLSPCSRFNHNRGLASSPLSYDYENQSSSNYLFLHPPAHGSSFLFKCRSLVTGYQSFATMDQFWERNRSYVLVILSTVFGSVMTLLAKLLEDGGNGMDPFQILFFRMFITWIVLSVLLFFRRPSEFPWGPASSRIRWLLVARGIAGYFGICGIWTSIRECLNLSRDDVGSGTDFYH